MRHCYRTFPLLILLDLPITLLLTLALLPAQPLVGNLPGLLPPPGINLPGFLASPPPDTSITGLEVRDVLGRAPGRLH